MIAKSVTTSAQVTTVAVVVLLGPSALAGIYASEITTNLAAIVAVGGSESRSVDCNNNGIPDEEELAGNDCNDDGIPDECGVFDECLSWRPTFPAPLNTNAATDFGDDFVTDLVTDGLGNWMAVWTTRDDLGGTIGTDRDILYSRSTDNTKTWTEPAPLNSNATSDFGHDSGARVNTDGQGLWLAVWNSNDDPAGTIGSDYDIYIARSTDNGASWSSPSALNTDAASDPPSQAGDDTNPVFATDSLGNWVVMWQATNIVDERYGSDLYFARSTDDGMSWTPPTPIHDDTGAVTGWDFAPDITTDGAGNWLTVWYSTKELSGTLGSDYDILFVRSTDNGSTWSLPATINHDATRDDGGDRYPEITTDRLGTWLVVWSSEADLHPIGYPVGLGNDEDILMARSLNNGFTWTNPVPLNEYADSDSAVYPNNRDVRPTVVSDGQGTWLAVWYSTYDLNGMVGTDWDIMMRRSANAGGTWTPTVAVNTNANTDHMIPHPWLADDTSPSLTTDGMGNWVFAWNSENNLGGPQGSDYDIHYARIADSGEDCNCNAVPDSCERATDDCDVNGKLDNCELADGAADCQPNDILDVCELVDNDCDANGVPDECDLAFGANDCQPNGVIDECELAGNDCDGSGVPDVCEIVDAARDCQPNGTLDVCELVGNDCDGNGIPDICDIAEGANDCQPNGRLDVCELVPVTDCNDNGIPDDCEIAEGATDCQPNGRLDVCESDCNGNGIADDCEGVEAICGDGCCSSDENAEDCPADCLVIPTVSVWGVVVLGLLVLSAGTALLRDRRFAGLAKT